MRKPTAKGVDNAAKSIAAILKEVMTNEASALLDTDAHNKAMDADAALQELGSDAIGQAFITATVTVWDDDPRVADEKLRLVEKVVQGRDFTCMVESVNAVDAWLGSLPGHAYANVRQPPISTLNLAHMIPLSAVWAGPARDEHFGAPALFFARTEGATPFRFSLHVGAAQRSLHEAGRNVKQSREVIDQVAAQLILQGWLDSQAMLGG